MNQKLLVNPGTPQAWEIQLRPGVNRLGRGEQNDFQIPHGSVSGTHCEFIVSESGVILRDLGSTNGTFINRARVQEVALQPGNHVQLGAVDIIFESAVPAAAAAPPAPIVARISTPAAAPAANPPLPPPVTARATAVRLSGTAPPPAPAAVVAATTAEPPIAPSVSPMLAAGTFCKFHAKTPARFYCPKCAKYYCDLCVGTRSSPAGTVHTCRTCSSNVTPVQVNLQRPDAGEKSFYGSLPGAFAYPFRGFGIMAVLLAAALLGGESFLGHMRRLGGPYGWALRTVVFGFTFLFMQNIIHTTTSDEKAPLEFPDATEFFSGAFSLGLTVLMSFGLPIGLGIARIFGVEIPGAAILATMIIGFAYFPMALLAVAMKDNPLAANPLVVIPAILKIPVEYGITAIILLSAYGLRQLGDMIAMAAGGVAFSTKDTNVLMIALVSQAAIAVGGVYLLTVCGRVLGLLYNRKKRELAWFSH